MDKQETVLLVLLDLSAAFDTINHDILLPRLEHTTGITGSALAWFSSYLKGRSMCASVDGIHSSKHNLKHGVPQGSVLGPVLFSIYITPLYNIFRKHHLNYHGYADDNQLYLSVKHSAVRQGVVNIENCIIDVRKWMASNFLKLNSDKTEFILLGTSYQLSKVENLRITVAQDSVGTSKEVKNLGVVFNENMSPSVIALNTARVANFHLTSIGKIRKYLDIETCKTMVHAYVTSRLDYCNALLAGSSATSHLQRIQNKALSQGQSPMTTFLQF